MIRHILTVWIAAACFAISGCAGNSGNSESILPNIVGDWLPPSPGEAARDAFNPYDPDQRRRSINRLSNATWGGEEPYVKTYRLLINDDDPTVRSAAIRALGRHGTGNDVPLIVPFLSDKTVFVRWEAAMALQRLHNPEAIDPLMLSLRGDDDPDVRIACATALGQYSDRRAFNALVGALADDDFGVVAASVESLQTLTGQQFGEDGAKWLEWERSVNDPFKSQEQFLYTEYVRPPGMLDRLQFWKKPKVAVPQEPRGVVEVTEPVVPTVSLPPSAEPLVTPAPQPVVITPPAPTPPLTPQPVQTVQQPTEASAVPAPAAPLVRQPKPAPATASPPAPSPTRTTTTSTTTPPTRKPAQPSPAQPPIDPNQKPVPAHPLGASDGQRPPE